MNLKRLAEISPIIGAFLIFIGYLKLYLYYDHWDINISNYLDFSEITLSFLNDTNTVLFLTLMLLLQMTVGIVAITTIDNKINSEPNKKYTRNHSQTDEFEGIIPTIEKAIEENHKPLVIILFVLTAIFFSLFLFFLKLIFLYISFIFFVQLLILFLDKIIGIKNEKSLSQISFVIILLGFTFCLAKYDIHQTETLTKQIILETDSNQVIQTDKNFILLGKTNNYYFFFDKIKKQSTIIPEKSILKTIKNN